MGQEGSKSTSKTLERLARAARWTGMSWFSFPRLASAPLRGACATVRDRQRGGKGVQKDIGKEVVSWLLVVWCRERETFVCLCLCLCMCMCVYVCLCVLREDLVN